MDTRVKSWKWICKKKVGYEYEENLHIYLFKNVN